MSEEKLNQVLKNGIYGTPETKPEERRLFLSTIRERVYLALTLSQVKHKEVYPEVKLRIQLTLKRETLHLYLNDHLPYSYLSKYIQLATSLQCPFTIVQNNDSRSPLGLVLANDKAIDLEEIYIQDDLYEKDMKG